MFEHGIEDGEEFSHTGNESNHLGLTGSKEALIKGSDDGVVASRDEGTHIKGRAYGSASTLSGAATAKTPGVAIDGSDAGESGDLMTIEQSEFGELD